MARVIYQFAKIGTGLAKVRFFTTALLLFPLLTSCASGVKMERENLRIYFETDEVAGVLLLPEGPGPFPAVMIIHGDGETTWDAYGYYKPLQQAMVEAGFAVLSWDKPGIGNSTGNWLTYSMNDRANLVIEARKLLRDRVDIKSNTIGLWGISQAGWVMPETFVETDAFAFMITVSPAINWIQQGHYMMSKRLKAEGYSQDAISEAIEASEKGNEYLGHEILYRDYVEYTKSSQPCCQTVMSQDRWEFVRKNVNSDASKSLARITVPILAIFGEFDNNVDVEDSVQYFEELRSAGNNLDVTIKTFRSANHSIMPAASNDPAMNNEMSIYKMLMQVEFYGADAFAPGYIDYTVKWMTKRFKN